MSVRKITSTAAEHAKRICLHRGLVVNDGHVSYDKDGVVVYLSESMNIDKGKNYSIELPHNINVLGGVVLVSIPPDVAAVMSTYSIPTTLSTGAHKLKIHFKAAESATLDKIVKLHMLELNP